MSVYNCRHGFSAIAEIDTMNAIAATSLADSLPDDIPGLLNVISSALVCSICTKLLQNPVAAPCRHIFCHDCIGNAVKDLNESNQPALCPACSTGIIQTSLSPARRTQELLIAFSQLLTAHQDATQSSSPTDCQPQLVPSTSPLLVKRAQSSVLCTADGDLCTRASNTQGAMCDEPMLAELPKSTLSPSLGALTHTQPIVLADSCTSLPRTSPVILCGDLDAEMLGLVQLAVQRLDGKIVDSVSADFTHFIVTADAAGYIARNSLYMHALVHGAWVVDFSWIKHCLDESEWLTEDTYEIKGDIFLQDHSVLTRSRRAAKEGRLLLQGMLFHLLEPFPRPMYDELKLLLVRAGGELCSTAFHSTDDRPLYILTDPTWCKENIGKVKASLGIDDAATVLSSMWILHGIAEYTILSTEEY